MMVPSRHVDTSLRCCEENYRSIDKDIMAQTPVKPS